LHDNYQDREIVDQVLAPLKELKLLEPTMRRTFGRDHASFDDVGVPGFFVVQDSAEYNQTHHSQVGYIRQSVEDDLNQGVQGVWRVAYNTAQLPAMLPRRPLPYGRPLTRRRRSAQSRIHHGNGHEDLEQVEVRPKRFESESAISGGPTSALGLPDRCNSIRRVIGRGTLQRT